MDCCRAGAYDSKSFFSKMRVPLTRSANLGFTMGYGKPENDLGQYERMGIGSLSDLENFHATVFVGGRPGGRTWILKWQPII